MATTNEELVEEFKHLKFPALDDIAGWKKIDKWLMKALATKDAAWEERVREEKKELEKEIISDLEQCKFYTIVDGETYTPTEINEMFNGAIGLVKCAFAPDQLTDKPHDCQGDMVLTSNPPQYKCSKCGRTEKQPF